MIDKFKKYLVEQGRSSHTIRNYLTYIRVAIKENIITPDMSNINIQKLLVLDTSTQIKSRIRCSLRKYSHFLVMERILSQIPQEIMAVELPKIKSTIPKITKSSEVCKILQYTTNPEIKAILYILVTTGCRIGSLVDLRVEDINDTEITFNTAKGGKPYKAALTEDTKTAVHNHIQDRHGYLFINNRGNKATADSIRIKLRRKLGKDYVNCHSLRHGFATELIENGADILDVKEVLNHSSIATTQKYIHLSPKYIQDKIKAFHPLLG
jgi:site-specific recombinase XerD